MLKYLANRYRKQMYNIFSSINSSKNNLNPLRCQVLHLEIYTMKSMNDDISTNICYYILG